MIEAIIRYKKKISIKELSYSLTDLTLKFLTFMTMPIFFRYLTPADYGKISLFTSYLGIFSIVLGLNISSGILRLNIKKESNLKNIGTIYSFILVMTVIAIFIFVFSKESIYRITSQNFQFFILLLIGACFKNFNAVGLEVFRMKEQVKNYSVLSLLQHTLQLALGIILVITLKDNKAFWRNFSLTAAFMVTGCASFWHIIKNYGFKLNKLFLKEHLNYSVPLVGYSVSAFILSFFDRIIINQYYDSYEVGIYSFAYNIGMLVYVVSVGLIKSFQPVFFKDYEKKEIINKIMLKYTKIFTLSYIVILLSTNLLILVFGPNYREARSIIPYINLTYALLYFNGLIANELYYLKKTKVLSVLTMFSALLNIVLNYLFVPKYGYVAAAYTTIASYFITLLLNYLYCKFYLKLDLNNQKNTLKYFILLIIVTILYKSILF